MEESVASWSNATASLLILVKTIWIEDNWRTYSNSWAMGGKVGQIYNKSENEAITYYCIDYVQVK